MPAVTFDPVANLVLLAAEGGAELLPRSAEGWKAVNHARGERVIGLSRPQRGEDLHPHVWEMHPDGDELLHLVRGGIDLVLDEPHGERRIPLLDGQSCIVKRGAWHRLVLREPSILLFVTPAGGTRMRPCTPKPAV